ncbi:helix-turn-helix transcriptional regulator [Streptantibioticus ferralitis]|uniref:Helix-turn-helix transcriptional regulator n=1 Tax=Streptantibioticus ferralitis TaxID=236510 RepID=A0ABT5ZC66_9ACTN|nr:helix-turn-helix transcriptional regulator [Streptantibioticus ferralitis]
MLQRRRVIGTRVRDARLHRNLTQERLAERVGLDRKTVNRLELGHIPPAGPPHPHPRRAGRPAGEPRPGLSPRRHHNTAHVPPRRN